MPSGGRWWPNWAVDAAQGFYWATPIATGEFAEWWQRAERQARVLTFT